MTQLILIGPSIYIKAFKEGFNKVFDIDNLKCFSSIELEEIICGCSSEPWDIDTLNENIIPNHGYDKKSQIYLGLLNMMKNFDNMDRKKFLLFVTGSPRLPLGGKI
jgi:E3 ubiquitin-protein ligase TRIP12